MLPDMFCFLKHKNWLHRTLFSCFVYFFHSHSLCILTNILMADSIQISLNYQLYNINKIFSKPRFFKLWIWDIDTSVILMNWILVILFYNIQTPCMISIDEFQLNLCCSRCYKQTKIKYLNIIWITLTIHKPITYLCLLNSS